jgi:hypothetical protein
MYVLSDFKMVMALLPDGWPAKLPQQPPANLPMSDMAEWEKSTPYAAWYWSFTSIASPMASKSSNTLVAPLSALCALRV